MVVGAAHQPAEGLFEAQPGHVVDRRARRKLAPGAVQDVGRGQGTRSNTIRRSDRPRHVDPVAHRVGAQQAGVRLGPEDVDQASAVSSPSTCWA